MKIANNFVHYFQNRARYDRTQELLQGAFLRVVSKINFLPSVRQKIMKMPFKHFLDCKTNLMVDISFLDEPMGRWGCKKLFKFGKNPRVEFQVYPRECGRILNITYHGEKNRA